MFRGRVAAIAALVIAVVAGVIAIVVAATSHSSGPSASNGSTPTISASSTPAVASTGSTIGSTSAAASSVIGTTTAPRGLSASGAADSAPPEVPTTPSVAVCKITAAKTAASAFGGTVRQTTGGKSGTGADICSFAIQGSNVGAPVTVQMSRTTQMTLRVFRQIESQAGGTPVTGVGQAAYYLPQQYTVRWYADSSAVAAAVSMNPPPTTLQASSIKSDLIALARKVAGS